MSYAFERLHVGVLAKHGLGCCWILATFDWNKASALGNVQPPEVRLLFIRLVFDF